MARLQILELPEGSNDDRPPFVLVIDQMPKDEAAFDALRRDLSDDLAQRTGARAILVFEDTIDIPANDASGYLRETEAAWMPVDEMRANLIDTLNEKPTPQQTAKSASQEQR